MESNVRGISFSNSKIIEEISTKCCSFEIKKIRERKFVNKFGDTIYEDLIYMVKKDVVKNKISPYEVASQHLSAAKNDCPKDSISDLENAMQEIGRVVCSPPFVEHDAA